MAERKDDKSRRRSKREEDKDLRALYAKARREFTAADLQKYTVIEKGIAWRVPTAGLARLTQEGARMVQLRKRAAQ